MVAIWIAKRIIICYSSRYNLIDDLEELVPSYTPGFNAIIDIAFPPDFALDRKEARFSVAAGIIGSPTRLRYLHRRAIRRPMYVARFSAIGRKFVFVINAPE